MAGSGCCQLSRFGEVRPDFVRPPTRRHLVCLPSEPAGPGAKSKEARRDLAQAQSSPPPRRLVTSQESPPRFRRRGLARAPRLRRRPPAAQVSAAVGDQTFKTTVLKQTAPEPAQHCIDSVGGPVEEHVAVCSHSHPRRQVLLGRSRAYAGLAFGAQAREPARPGTVLEPPSLPRRLVTSQESPSGARRRNLGAPLASERAT